MLVACYGTHPPPVSLPVRLRGRHKVFVGLYGEHGFYPGIRVKLKKDQCFRTLVLQESISNGDIKKEVFWKEADLTDETIHIAVQNMKDRDSITSGIVYKRFVPVEKIFLLIENLTFILLLLLMLILYLL